MTPDNHIPDNTLVDRPVDRILDHNRLQLSALLDGELPPHEARFLLRRLQHDPELAACWDHWNLCADVLRGRVEIMASNGFSERVASALAAEPVSKAVLVAPDSRWLRWGGGTALAASVAVIALLLGRQSPQAGSPALPTPQVVTTTTAAPPASATNVATPASPGVPIQGAQLATALAVAELPRRLTAGRSRGQSQRAALRTASRGIIQIPVAMASASPQALPQKAQPPTDPFSAQHASPGTRPWPRALLPGSPANGAFTVDYGNRSGESGVATSPSFYPFEPRDPVTVPSAPPNPP